MRKQILCWGFFLLFIQNAFSENKLGKIVFYRDPNFKDTEMSYNLMVGDSILVNLKKSSFYSHSFKPGEYDFQINNLPKSKLHLKVEQGRTYYLRFGLNSGLNIAVPEIIKVDSFAAYPIVYQSILRKPSDENGTNSITIKKKSVQYERLNNRFGVNLNLGFGSDAQTLVMTKNYQESKISFGGGAAIGLKYGHEFNEYFDLAFDLNYQFSRLIPLITNGSVTFNRGIFSVTPSYIFPINGGDDMRIKFGGGMDVYLSPTLKIDLVKVPDGFKDAFVYSTSLGYHLSAIFERNFSSKWSFNGGLKYYAVSYTYEKSEVRYPTTKEFTNPNGAGIDVVMGLCYHF